MNLAELRDSIFLKASANGCKPFWYDGMFGWAWHCGCNDNKHGSDSQCSMITVKSVTRA